jgi:hypothetical protein
MHVSTTHGIVLPFWQQVLALKFCVYINVCDGLVARSWPIPCMVGHTMNWEVPYLRVVVFVLAWRRIHACEQPAWRLLTPACMGVLQLRQRHMPAYI